MIAEGPMVAALLARLPDPALNLAAYGGIVRPLTFAIESPLLVLLTASATLCKNWETYQKGTEVCAVVYRVLYGDPCGDLRHAALLLGDRQLDRCAGANRRAGSDRHDHHHPLFGPGRLSPSQSWGIDPLPAFVFDHDRDPDSLGVGPRGDGFWSQFQRVIRRVLGRTHDDGRCFD